MSGAHDQMGTPAQARLFAGLLAGVAAEASRASNAAARALAGLPPEPVPKPDVEAGLPPLPFIRPPAMGPDHDPAKDSRPEARSIFNPAFVDVPEATRKAAVASRRKLSLGYVKDAWWRGGWGKMPYMPLTGPQAWIVERQAFLDALPHLGTNRIAYHAAENWVCREYGFLGAAVVAAELQCASGIVCDDTGHHLYCQTPVYTETLPDTGKGHDAPVIAVEVLVWEPQADQVVWHTDPARHYTGEQGFAILV